MSDIHSSGDRPDVPAAAPPAAGPPVRLLRPDAHRPGRLLMQIRRTGVPLLVTAALGEGVGSSELGLDRGRLGKGRLAEFRRAGDRVVLVLTPKHHRATGEPAAVAAGAESFADSAVWSAPVLHQSPDGPVVDATGLALLDLHGVAATLAARGQGEHDLDRDASHLIPEQVVDGPRGPRLTARLTFRTARPGEAVSRVAPLPGTVSVVQHLHLVPLPATPLAARRHHPASGGYGLAHHDHAAPAEQGTGTVLQPRFRTPADGAGEPVVFLVDPAVPEPWRTAVVEGGSWWAEAFERAGLPGAFRVEIAPDGTDLHDLAHNVVLWVHRDGRGWSHGQALTDPRTGEILAGRVRLGSQRVEQVTALAEALLAPYGHPEEAERRAVVRETVLRRMRRLAAHEIGHALGFMHNFADRAHPLPSVMDYPHPEVALGDDGALDLSEPYHQGLGPWDHFLVAHAYGPVAGAAPAELRGEVAGLGNLADEDAQGPGAAHADGGVWLPHQPDPFAGLAIILAVRRAALAGFTRGVLPPHRQAGELESRAAALHLLHRHALTAVARQVGGVRYRYALAGDPATDEAGTEPVAAADQWSALRRCADLLAPEVLVLPAAVERLLAPPVIRHTRSAEYLDTRAGRIFDPLSAVEAAAAVVAEALLEPARLTRAAWQHATDPDRPGPGDIADTLLDACWPPGLQPAEEPGTTAALPPGQVALARRTAGWVVVRYLAAATGGEALPAAVRDEVEDRLRALAERLDPPAAGMRDPAGTAAASRATGRRVRAFLAAPTAAGLGALPRIPPGAPL
ncbi:zinc-dependent metalloprotease [Streptomyces bohaiensis]|uniref:zinc-dependent metalloprotease n=1 Tax=Streptomyces bohaiensis TaxID=1431344 RepID=UPI003B7F3C6F